jgi:hypothetical protein
MTELIILAPLDGAPIRVDVAFGGFAGQERAHRAKVIWPDAISLSSFDPHDVLAVPEAMYDLGAAPYQYDGPLATVVRPPKPAGIDPAHSWQLNARFLPRFGVTIHTMFGPDQHTTMLLLAGYVPPSEEMRLLPLALVQAITEHYG